MLNEQCQTLLKVYQNKVPGEVDGVTLFTAHPSNKNEMKNTRNYTGDAAIITASEVIYCDMLRVLPKRWIFFDLFSTVLWYSSAHFHIERIPKKQHRTAFLSWYVFTILPTGFGKSCIKQLLSWTQGRRGAGAYPGSLTAKAGYILDKSALYRRDIMKRQTRIHIHTYATI